MNLRHITFIGTVIILLGTACSIEGKVAPVSTAPNTAAGEPTPQTAGQNALSLPPITEEESTASPPRRVQIPIWISDGHMEPKVIELFVGQELFLDIYNQGAQHHSFTIGRNLLWAEDRPAGFEVGLLDDRGGILYGGGGIVEIPYAREDPDWWNSVEQMGWLEGQLVDYDKLLFILPRPRWSFAWKDFQPVIPDFSFYTHVFVEELIVTSDMIGVWEYACFSGNGQHYLDGERGKIIVKQPPPR